MDTKSLVDKHETTLYGNGKEGITTKVAKLAATTNIILALQTANTTILIALVVWILQNGS